MNALNLQQLWAQSDLITHTVAAILLIMSILSWAVMLGKLWQQYALFRDASQRDRELIAQTPNTNGHFNPFHELATAGYRSKMDFHGQPAAEQTAVTGSSCACALCWTSVVIDCSVDWAFSLPSEVRLRLSDYSGPYGGFTMPCRPSA